MSRTITILFRRDPSGDRQEAHVRFEGYRPYWPDGRAVNIGLDAFCKHGLRLLGLGKQLADGREKLLHLVCHPLQGRDDSLTRLPGYRVRRFFIARKGPTGRIHFLDGTPTIVTFELGRDEPQVLHWIGLVDLADGDRLWFDLAARAVDASADVSAATKGSQSRAG